MKRSKLESLVHEILKETIRKVGDKYAVYPEKGGKRLGTHDTRKEAKKQLTAIHISQKNENLDPSYKHDGKAAPYGSGYRPVKESKDINYSKPNFEFEWEEANRYPEFQKIGKEGWIEVSKKGKPVNYSSIKDSLGNVDLNFKGLDKDKKERFQAAFRKGTIETPIAVKFSNSDYDLVAGNTRLSGLVNNGIDPKIWVVDITNLSEDVHEPMNPGILKKRLGSLSCTKVRKARGKLKDKGTTYAKALQRYLNYHCN